MSDINLLPEDFRAEEAKIKPGQGPKEPASFHIPDHQQEVQVKPPAEPKDMFEEGRIKVSQQPPQPDFTDRKTLAEISRSDGKKDEPASVSKPKFEVKAKEQPRAKADKPGFFKNLLTFKKPEAGQAGSGSAQAESGEPVLDKPFDVNLIPAGSYLIANKRIYLYLITSALSAFLVLSLSLLVLTFLARSLKSQSETITAQLAESEQKYELLKVKETEALAWSQRIGLVKNLLSKHVYWTQFFSELEKITLPEVYYSSIEASMDGLVTLTASADSYSSIARQYLVYQQAEDILKKAEVSGLSGDPLSGAVNFQALLELNEDIYYSYQ